MAKILKQENTGTTTANKNSFFIKTPTSKSIDEITGSIQKYSDAFLMEI